MRITRTYQDLPPETRGASAAIGNFDGVHIGHQAVIDLARAEARRSRTPLGVVTFEPHPRQVFAPTAAPFRLMNAETKQHRLEKLGVDLLYQLPFSSDLFGLTAETFAKEVIVDGLGLSHVVVGEDFRFGRGRKGTPDLLQDMGARLGFGVTVAELVSNGTNEVSSTAIRTALSEGHPETAAKMLGHWHRIEGEVLHGEKRGRDLGYPTANMSIEGLHPPRFGVYAVTVDVLTGPHRGTYGGAASLGVRPMFGVNQANLETYLLDFKGDLYDAHLSVGLVEYLRDEMTFDGLDGLIAQMALDCDRARARLVNLTLPK